MTIVLVAFLVVFVIGVVATLVWLFQNMQGVLDDERELDTRLTTLEAQLRNQRREWATTWHCWPTTRVSSPGTCSTSGTA